MVSCIRYQRELLHLHYFSSAIDSTYNSFWMDLSKLSQHVTAILFKTQLFLPVPPNPRDEFKLFGTYLLGLLVRCFSYTINNSRSLSSLILCIVVSLTFFPSHSFKNCKFYEYNKATEIQSDQRFSQ